MMRRRFLVLILFILSFTLSSFLRAENADNESRDDTQTYHVFDDVYLISTLKMAYKKPRITAKSVFPQLQSDSDEEGMDQFNEAAQKIVEEEINEFADQVVQSNASKKGKNYLYIDYSISAIQSGNHHILSIRFAIQGFIAGVRQPYHYHRVLNYDLERNQTMALEDLFNIDANYLEVLSTTTQNILSRRLAKQSFIRERTAARSENFENWNIKPNGLVITLDEYKLGPYHADMETVTIPFSALKQILSPESSIAACAFNKKCGKKNLLTGGFIDEAINSNHGRLNPSLSQM